MSGEIFHVTWPRMKHEENSPQGDREAKRRHCIGIDHDWQKDADGVIWNTHWQQPCDRDGFKDPLGKVGRHAKMRTLHEAAIRRLVAKHDGEEYHIRTATQGIRHAARVGLEVVQGECKPGNVWTVEDFRTLKGTARRAGIRLVIKTMDNWPGWRQTLANAEAAGLPTRRIHMNG